MVLLINCITYALYEYTLQGMALVTVGTYVRMHIRTYVLMCKLVEHIGQQGHVVWWLTS